MTSKNKDIKEEPKEEEKTTSKEKVKTPKKTGKKTGKKEVSKKKTEELSTLVELVESLEDKENIFLRLSMNNYFNQYMDEKEYRRRGYEITPYINVDEFYKKMKR